MRVHGYITALAFLAWTLLSVCTAQAGAGILVSAAVSLSDSFTEIGVQFEAKNPDVTVEFNFAASGVLLRQMELGAPVDVFASADMRTMDEAVTNRIVDGRTVKVFAENSLVLIVPTGSSLGLNGPEGLLSERVARVVLGNPETVPAGEYARQALKSAGVWYGLKDKVVFAENVRQVLDFVRRGEVDAGAVYATDAMGAEGAVRIAARLLTDTPVLYPAAVAKKRANNAAERFVRYLAGAEAAAVLRRYGFSPAGDGL